MAVDVAHQIVAEELGVGRVGDALRHFQCLECADGIDEYLLEEYAEQPRAVRLR